jgi:predicted nucleotidyltransferase
MNNRSWSIVPDQDPRYCLPADLRQRDSFGARDCGYVEQMRPFIREFSKPGNRVFDPFCGFATTLLAAHLEGRAGIGTEADAARAAIARERLQRHSSSSQTILVGGCLEHAATLPQVDLILTSVPYFGCRWPGDAVAAQLYDPGSYANYLEAMRRILQSLKGILAPSGFIILMAENVRIGAQFVPLAWDVARLLGERFTMCDERVLVYERAGSPVDHPSISTNRAHEYALIAQKVSRPIDITETRETLRSLVKVFPESIVYGSFAKQLQDPSRLGSASDVDVLVPFDTDLLTRMSAWLEAEEFRLLRWGSPISSSGISAAARDSFYIRAERLRADGKLVVIDLSFDPTNMEYERAKLRAVQIEELKVLLD